MCLGCLGFGLCFLAFECYSVFHVKRGGLAECFCSCSVFHVKRLPGAEGGSGFT